MNSLTPLTIIDDPVETNLFAPFAYTDLYTLHTSQTQEHLVHFWEFDRTVILGMKDTRLPFLTDGLNLLHQAGFRYLARNSGGLGVVSNEGVLNVSLFLPNPNHQISIPEGYAKMVDLIQDSFSDFHVAIEAKEISDSYCPGEFDLSIQGQKFAGIAQRRIKEGISVMIYLSVHGDQSARGQLMKEFYQASLKQQFGTNGYPPINPNSMANLSDLLGENLTISAVKKRLLDTLEKSYRLIPTTSEEFIQSHHYQQELIKHQNKMEKRNEGVILHD